MSNKRRRSSKKKHEVPLTEDMLNELNKASLGHQGYMMHGNNHHGMGYDNYGQDPDDFFDSDDVWNNDKYYHGQQRYKVSSLPTFFKEQSCRYANKLLAHTLRLFNFLCHLELVKVYIIMQTTHVC